MPRAASSARLLPGGLICAFMSDSSAVKPFDLQGHRGARGLRPENTLPGFAHALSIGVSTLELDTAVTKDGVVIVAHDRRLNPDLARGPSGAWLGEAGPTFFSLTYEEVLRYDVGRIRPGSAYARRFPDQLAIDGTRVPRLQDLFSLVKDAGNDVVRFNIETKIDPRHPEETLDPESFSNALVDEIRRADVSARAMIQSFDWRTLKIVQRIAPEIQTVCLTTQHGDDDNVWLGKPGTSPWLAGLSVADFADSIPGAVRACGADVWSPSHLELNVELLKVAHGLGLRVIPWTVNDVADMRRLIAAGVDGLISDRPDLLRTVLAESRLPLPTPTPIAL